MQELNTYYPVKIVSRSVTKKRFRRVSWFVLGASFGGVIALALTGSLRFYSPMLVAQPANQDIELVDNASDLHTTQGIDVVALALPPPPAKPAAKPHPTQTYPLSLAMKVEN